MRCHATSVSIKLFITVHDQNWMSYLHSWWFTSNRHTHTHSKSLFSSGNQRNLNVAGISVVVVQMSFTSTNGTVFVAKKKEKWLANQTCILAHEEEEETIKKMRKFDLWVSLLMRFVSELKKNPFKLRSVRYRKFLVFFNTPNRLRWCISSCFRIWWFILQFQPRMNRITKKKIQNTTN